MLVLRSFFFLFDMGFSGERIFGMLFSPPIRFYIIRNHFIRNQIVDFDHSDDVINQGIVLLVRFLRF